MGFSKSFGGAIYGSLVKAGTGIGGRSGGGGAGREYAIEDVRKPSMCNHWRNGTDCPYGDRCMYAHGEDDPRKFSSRPPPPPVRFGFGGKDPFTDPEVEASVPVKDGAPARFFVLRSLNHDNLAVSVLSHTGVGKKYFIEAAMSAIMVKRAFTWGGEADPLPFCHTNFRAPTGASGTEVKGSLNPPRATPRSMPR